MRTWDEYRTILALWEKGYNKSQIEAKTGIPRATARDCIDRYGTLEALELHLIQFPRNMLVERLQKQTDENLLLNYSYILGMYLGDGEVSKVRNVYRLSVFLDYRYPNIIQRCANALQILLPENQIGVQNIEHNGHMSYSIVGAYYADFPQVFPQHGVGMKYTRAIVLADWQQQIVDKFPLEFWRGLYHSDGSRFVNRVNGYEYSRYQFSNVSTDIIKMFCDTCDRLDIHWTTKSRPGKNAPLHDVFISKRKDVEYLDSVVGPKT